MRIIVTNTNQLYCYDSPNEQIHFEILKFAKNWVLNGIVLYMIQINLKSCNKMTYNLPKKVKKVWYIGWTDVALYTVSIVNKKQEFLNDTNAT